MDKIFTIKKIHVINSGKPTSVRSKYIVYCYINYVINLLLKLRKLVEIKNKLLQVTKKTADGLKTGILVPDSIDDENFGCMETKLDCIEENNDMGNVIFRKFNICDEHNNVCLKDYLIEYKDYDKNFDNTIENILLFNNVNIIGNPLVEISYRKDSVTNNLQILYNDIKTKHICDIKDIKLG